MEHLEKCGLFADFHYGFRCFCSTADLLIVLSNRLMRELNRSWNSTLTLDISKAFDSAWHTDLLQSYGVSGRIYIPYGLILCPSFFL